MNDFEWDSLQKKRIAQSAKHRKGRKKGCTLPSDYMTAAQKKKLNGEVITMNKNLPMSWKAYKRLPAKMQEEYYNGLVERFDVGNSMIASMFDVTPYTLAAHNKKLGLNIRLGKFRKGSREGNKFEEWYIAAQNGSPETEEEKTEREQIGDLVGDMVSAVKERGNDSMVSGFEFTFRKVHGWTDIMRLVCNMPLPVDATVKIVVEEEK